MTVELLGCSAQGAGMCCAVLCWAVICSPWPVTVMVRIEMGIIWSVKQ